MVFYVFVSSFIFPNSILLTSSEVAAHIIYLGVFLLHFDTGVDDKIERVDEAVDTFLKKIFKSRFHCFFFQNDC